MSDIYTTEKGCFNCGNFENCCFIEGRKKEGYNFKEVFQDNALKIPYVRGCACTTYKSTFKKEQVAFT